MCACLHVRCVRGSIKRGHSDHQRVMWLSLQRACVGKNLLYNLTGGPDIPMHTLALSGTWSFWSNPAPVLHDVALAPAVEQRYIGLVHVNPQRGALAAPRLVVQGVGPAPKGVHLGENVISATPFWRPENGRSLCLD